MGREVGDWGEGRNERGNDGGKEQGRGMTRLGLNLPQNGGKSQILILRVEAGKYGSDFTQDDLG